MTDPYRIDESAERWLLKTARKHFWRVQNWYDFEDLVQDGYMCWYFTISKYALTARQRCIDARRNKPLEDSIKEVLMSLFTKVYMSHITELSNSKTRCQETVLADLVRTTQDEISTIEKLLSASATCDAYFNAMVRCAPDGVRQVLEAYMEQRPVVSSCYRVRGGIRETLNERFCRIAEKDPDKIDLVYEVKAYLNSMRHSKRFVSA